ncbi:MAG: 3',5'-cyclic-AMP phosphodiesterase [Gammaproteobacteria bacterium]
MTRTTPIRILQISDLHIMPNNGGKMLGINTEHYFHSVLQHAHDFHARYDLILVSGDLVQEPLGSSYRRIREHLATYQTECICLPGNHDEESLMELYLNGGTVNCNKQRMFERWQLICLNSRVPEQAGGYLTTDELAFLESCLENRPDLFTLIAVHHHCVPAQSDWLDTMIIANHPKFFDIIRRFPQIKAITTGHIHQEMDLIQGTVRILTTPSTCFQFLPKSHKFALDTAMPGYRVLELFPNGDLFTHVRRLPGELTELDDSSPGY